MPAAQYFSGRKSRRSLPNQWGSIRTAGSAVTLTAFSTAPGSVMPRVKWIDTGMPTPTVEPSSGVYWPMKVFSGTSVVKLVSFADSRPLPSFATAWTVYFVAAARCRSGTQLRPSSAILPSTSLPLGSATFTVLSLPWAAETFSAPLVATSSAPSLGAIVTTACEALVSSTFAPACFPLLSAAAPLPPHAVTSNSSAPSTSARRPWAPRPRRSPLAPAHAPDIGCPFTVVVSPRTAWPRHGPHPRALYMRARRKIITPCVGRTPPECHRSVPTRPACTPSGPGAHASGTFPGRTGVQRRAEPAFHCGQPRFHPPSPLSGATVRSVELTTSTTSPTSVRSKNQPAGVSELPPFTSRSPMQPWLVFSEPKVSGSSQ